MQLFLRNKVLLLRLPGESCCLLPYCGLQKHGAGMAVGIHGMGRCHSWSVCWGLAAAGREDRQRGLFGPSLGPVWEKRLLNGQTGQDGIPSSSRDQIAQGRVQEQSKQAALPLANGLHLWDPPCHGGVSLYLIKFKAFGNPASAAGTACTHTRATMGGPHVDQR